MKTIKLGDQIKRVNEKDAIRLTRGDWNYCPKSEWKENVRVLPTKKGKKSNNLDVLQEHQWTLIKEFQK